MKKLILALTLISGAATIAAHADLTAPMSAAHIDLAPELVWLGSSDSVRTFSDSCNEAQTAPETKTTLRDYAAQGFVLLSKVKLPKADENGMGLPECAYIMVRANLQR